MPIIDTHVVHVLKNVAASASPANLLATLFWGEEVERVEPSGKGSHVVIGEGREGWTRSPVRTRPEGLLKLTFIDVGQGDACLLESPTGKKILVDGGEHQRLARYLARRFAGPKRDSLVVFDAVVVTHGDADHFSGLTALATSAADDSRPNKRIRFGTVRLFHNGLVKRPGRSGKKRRVDTEMFGRVVMHEGRLHAVDLVDELTEVDRVDMNRPFQSWAAAVERMRERHPIDVRRIERGDDKLFSFFDPHVAIEVLGPTTTKLKGKKRGLPFLNAPETGGASASHTINGHSIVLRLTYGSVRALLSADLNSAAEGVLLDDVRAGRLDLSAEILKAPHHGSGDFAVDFFRAVQPIISVVSAGDEDVRHEYIHPRANFMGALGKAGRTDKPIVIVTDLAAFDRFAGVAFPARRRANGSYEPDPKGKQFYARERTAFGVVHVRTDGKDVFVGTNSGRKGRVETYVFRIGKKHEAEPREVEVA